MLNVALTFDYELYFGENFGTANEILFDPTEELLNILDSHSVKATFFVDVLSVRMHEKYGLSEYCDRFIAQIKDMVNRGHDVQLHIHSNWLKSEYKDGKWVFDIDSYRIHTFGFDPEGEMSADYIIKWGKEFLENILKPTDPNYKCISYRAGGYCIQPHKELFKALLDNGIYVDSSVSMKQEAHSVNEYDYRNVPDANGWWVGIDSPLNEPVKKTNDSVYEVPVAYYRHSLVKRLLKPKEEKGMSHKLKGTYIKIPSVNNGSVLAKQSRINRLLSYNKTTRILSFDSTHYMSIVKTLMKRRKKCGKDYQSIAVIGHPKLIDNTWLENIDAFLYKVKNTRGIGTVTMQNIYADIKHPLDNRGDIQYE